MKIRIDTREQRPWSFPPGVETVVGTVHQGDYAVDGDNCFAVERKSAQDFRNTVVSDWPRFQAEMHRMDLVGAPNKVVIVECDFADYCFKTVRNLDACADAGEAIGKFAASHGTDAAVADFARWLYAPCETMPQPVAAPQNGEDAVFTPQLAARRVAELAVWNRAAVLFAYDADIAALMAFHILLQRDAQLKGIARIAKEVR